MHVHMRTLYNNIVILKNWQEFLGESIDRSSTDSEKLLSFIKQTRKEKNYGKSTRIKVQRGSRIRC